MRFAQEHGIRLIRYDRPGFGASTPAPGRRAVDAADDVRAIVDALGVETFAVEGSSAGGPHALAVAALLADRVSAVAVSASLAPVDGAGLDFLDGMAADYLPAWRAAMEGPDASAPFVREAADWWLAQTPATFVDAVRATGTDADVAALDAETAGWAVAHVREALRTGLDGYATTITRWRTPGASSRAMSGVRRWSGTARKTTSCPARTGAGSRPASPARRPTSRPAAAT